MNKITSFKKIGIIIILVLSMLFISACGTIFALDISQTNNDEEELPTVNSYENLIDLLGTYSNNQGGIFFGDSRGVLESDSAVKSEESAIQATGDDHSDTNVQVEGVDEADIVKTDGEYIYQINENKIIISKVFPADQMEVVNTITYDDGFYPSEIYIDDKYLVVIGNNNYFISMPLPEAADEKSQSVEDTGEQTEEDKEIARSSEDYRYIPDYQNRETVKVLIYNIEDPKNIDLVRDFEVEGYYISSRKIDSSLYLISNKYIYYYAEEADENIVLPWYRDSVNSEDFVAVGYDNIKYFPDGQESSYLMIAGLDLDKIQDSINVEAFLGAGQTIYSSLENLYVTISKWDQRVFAVRSSGISTNTDTVSVSNDKEETSVKTEEVNESEEVILPDINDVKTQIYRFTLKDGKATYAAKGEVPGTLLNQFSMDEYDGHFRVATTTGEVWRSDEFTSQNNIYILNANLQTVGSIENIASGERIYSVRFMGDRGYMVTFKTVDPLFVIDLKDPRQPKILGELKIPGYSDYLHPYDENHLIGFGMDTIELDIKDENGKIVGTRALMSGMKIAMFDVSDVNHPIEKYTVKIGDRGTYSDLLHNHKALVFSKEKNLLAFPVTVMETGNKKVDSNERLMEYGKFSFQGMYVYQVDPENGFDLKAQITHLTKKETDQASENWFDYQKTVTRGLYINNTFYSISNAYITAHSLETYAELGILPLQ